MLPLLLALSLGARAADPVRLPVKVEGASPLGLARYGLVDEHGAFVVPATLARVSRPSEGLVAACRDADGGATFRCGYLDLDGKPVLPFTWYDADPFSEGLAVVGMPEHRGTATAPLRYGLIDRSGAWVAEPIYLGLRRSSEGLVPFRLKTATEDRIGFLGKDGKEAFAMPEGTRDLQPFSEGLAPVRTEKGWGYIDKTGTWAIEPAYRWATGFSEHRAAVRTAAGAGFIDPTGIFVGGSHPEWTAVRAFAEGRGPFQSGGRWGYVDAGGAVEVPPRFLRAGSFHDGVAAVEREVQEWVYVDPSGAQAVPGVFTHAEPFRDGFARVEVDGAWVWIDREGHHVATGAR